MVIFDQLPLIAVVLFNPPSPPSFAFTSPWLDITHPCYTDSDYPRTYHGGEATGVGVGSACKVMPWNYARQLSGRS
ncbi:hypothetical protein B0I35DRAFT_420077 [Stachybotrys elegans]|uniref:Uncharacterized protein n=1 Tax=Stachybotrys elegans TaxID=80388 RepID=A0A8K0T3A2_9HYPO|nr:hypothetical protein B0I35DRAFT_420077 [Stachybotrys elegans]